MATQQKTCLRGLSVLVHCDASVEFDPLPECRMGRLNMSHTTILRLVNRYVVRAAMESLVTRREILLES
jgi:hypothetical protein